MGRPKKHPGPVRKSQPKALSDVKPLLRLRGRHVADNPKTLPIGLGVDQAMLDAIDERAAAYELKRSEYLARVLETDIRSDAALADRMDRRREKEAVERRAEAEKRQAEATAEWLRPRILDLLGKALMPLSVGGGGKLPPGPLVIAAVERVAQEALATIVAAHRPGATLPAPPSPVAATLPSVPAPTPAAPKPPVRGNAVTEAARARRAAREREIASLGLSTSARAQALAAEASPFRDQQAMSCGFCTPGSNGEHARDCPHRKSTRKPA